MAPNGDHEEDGEKQHADQRAEDESEADVRRQAACAAVRIALFGERVYAGPQSAEQPECGHRRLECEDRPPVESLCQHPSERRTERSAESAGKRPECRSPAE